MLYFVIFIILFVFSVLEISNINIRSNQILVSLSWLILVVVAGTRYETGADWDMYNYYFQQTNSIGNFMITGNTGLYGINIEFGYFLLCSILKQFGFGIQFLFFIVVLFNVTIITKALKHYTQYVVVGLWLYYCFLYVTVEFSLIRQALAVSICFYAFRFVVSKEWVKYFLFIFIAFSFHRSALVMFPLYFFFKTRFSNKTILILVISGSLLMLLKIKWLYSSILFVSGIFGDAFYQRALFYMNSGVFGVSRTVGVTFFFLTFLLLLFMWKRKEIESKKYGNLFFNIFVVYLVIFYYLYEFYEISVRFNLYFMFSLVVLFPYLLEMFKKQSNRIIIIVFLAMYCFTLNAKVYLNDPSTIVYNPYQNYFIHKLFNKESVGVERIEQNRIIVEQEREKMSKKNE
jgi:hypothetical protein